MQSNLTDRDEYVVIPIGFAPELHRLHEPRPRQPRELADLERIADIPRLVLHVLDTKPHALEKSAPPRHRHLGDRRPCELSQPFERVLVEQRLLARLPGTRFVQTVEL